MSAINNLKGHIVKDGKIVYSEELEPNLIFAVIEMYEPFYNKNNFSNSSELWLEAVITTGEKEHWSNGVVSLVEAERFETKLKTEKFDDLRTIKTKDGFKVWETTFGEYVDTKDPKKYKVRRVKWIVEVPKNNLAEFFKL